MLKIETLKVTGFEEAIHGMRNPMNSWAQSDSYNTYIYDEETMEAAPYEFFLGEKDLELAMKLSAGGPVHGKYKRMIVVYADVTAPLYWWKEYDTYKVGTVANSCSTMHKIHAKEFTREDFSDDYLIDYVMGRADYLNSNQNASIEIGSEREDFYPSDILDIIIDSLNTCRELFLKTNDKKYWWQMIQLLPSSYNQKRTIMLNYQVLTNIYFARRNHKLDEWHTFCDWIEQLPDSELITGSRDV